MVSQFPTNACVGTDEAPGLFANSQTVVCSPSSVLLLREGGLGRTVVPKQAPQPTIVGKSRLNDEEYEHERRMRRQKLVRQHQTPLAPKRVIRDEKGLVRRLATTKLDARKVRPSPDAFLGHLDQQLCVCVRARLVADGHAFPLTVCGLILPPTCVCVCVCVCV